jgi:hypothetical protein
MPRRPRSRSGREPRIRAAGLAKEERRQDAGSDDERSSFFAGFEKASVPAAWVRGPLTAAEARYSARTARSLSSALACRRETCICETLRRLAISVCETDS